ncbi:putative calcium-binding protein CML35 [Nicotiana tabacum]|uniref:Calcium-binding protein CML35 n=1 Tax=Nicotiana tabacum TaxID=4097 RepID=A0A1S3XLK3_TOBAC|nr:probable calcium-binding protein CML35 [Nicotiana tomentosiformis]XP_016440532.1 PREDICTED: probable calcium-binding protein CML35 [Nicotiana tabacum]
MKLIKNLPKKFFKSKKTRSISRSDDPSFSSGTTSSEYSLHKPYNGLSTPTSVLPTTLSNEISAEDWSSEEISNSGVYSDLVQAFSLIDGDGDGKIRKEQLEAILSRVGGKSPPSEEELISLLNEVDKNGDGCISLEDFGIISSAFELTEATTAEDGGDEMRDAFDFFDTDHDGKITAEELFNVFRMIGDARCTLEDCRRMIRSVDKNGDGFVCFEDFCLMMEHQR